MHTTHPSLQALIRQPGLPDAPAGIATGLAVVLGRR